jgi:hypothetical protein
LSKNLTKDDKLVYLICGESKLFKLTIGLESKSFTIEVDQKPLDIKVDKIIADDKIYIQNQQISIYNFTDKFVKLADYAKGDLVSIDKNFIYLKNKIMRKEQLEEEKSQEIKQKTDEIKEVDVKNLTIKDIEQFDALMKGVAVPSIANTNQFGNQDKLY